MITIANEYKEKIIGMFGEIGKNWIERVPSIIDKYINKFKLTDINIVSDLTYNILLFAKNNEFGDVVLKVELPFKEMTERESIALKLNNGVGACKCYYSNVDDGIILMERLLPGISLEEEKNFEKKVSIFSDVSRKFNIIINKDVNLPTYREILDRSISIIGENDIYSIMNLLETADKLYGEVEEEQDVNYLVHSDLHCGNILLSCNEWKVIDPHGFIGDRVLDIAIFVQKQLEKTNYSDENIDEILSIVSKYTSESEEKILKTLFVNHVLNMCWDIEVNFDKSHVEKCIGNCKQLLECYNKKYDKQKKLRKS